MAAQTVTTNVVATASGTIPAGAQNISLTIAGARGGTGGADSGGPGGGYGSGRYGVFSIPSSTSNRSWAAWRGFAGGNGPGGSGAVVGGPGGQNGNGKSGDGGGGGADGTSGWSGCGAGGGAASVFQLAGNDVVVAGGGGGGGGGSYSCGGPNRPGGTGGTAGNWVGSTNVSVSNGRAGANKGGGDGGGGGGGGGGAGGGGGGGAGTDCSNGGGGGGGGGSVYNSTVVSLQSSGTVTGDGYITLSYNLTVAEIVTFTVSPSTIIAGESVTLTWSVRDSNSQSINQGIGAVAASGDRTVSPTASTDYTLTAFGDAGNDTETVTVTVFQPVVITVFEADPNPITVGSNSTLTWAVSGDANTASIDQGIGNILFSSSTTVSPSSTTVYTLSASGPGGSDVRDVRLVVNQRPELAANFPVVIDYGESISVDVTYNYATSGVFITETYDFRDGTTSIITTTLAGTSSDEVSSEVTRTFTPAIPWGIHGPTRLTYSLRAVGGGGEVTLTPETIVVNIDLLPDSVNIPPTSEALPKEDPVVTPDEDTVISDPIIITDIDIPVEIKSNRPIQVKFDDDDPTIEANWNSLRQIT